MTLDEVLKKRTNITFFREDKIPEKKVIDDILREAHQLTPHKNNFYHYEIEVYGPEQDEDKKYATLATVCSDAKKEFRKSDNPDDFKHLEKVYEKWLDYHSTTVKNYQDEEFWKMREDLNKFHFNQQMRAPYLLVYSQRPELLTETQKNSQYYKTGKLRSVFNVNNNTRSNMWLIQAGMHGIITSMLAVDKGLDASFCKCFFYNTHIHSNIMRKARASADNIAFTLGIGYNDTTKMKYKSWVPRPFFDEIIKWV
tara:strand:- start:167 stop:928 length:762 start_codon:yes stop_codon:yes gene_type:complete